MKTSMKPGIYRHATGIFYLVICTASDEDRTVAIFTPFCPDTLQCGWPDRVYVRDVKSFEYVEYDDALSAKLAQTGFKLAPFMAPQRVG